jgi:hypothetical protein
MQMIKEIKESLVSIIFVGAVLTILYAYHLAVGDLIFAITITYLIWHFVFSFECWINGAIEGFWLTPWKHLMHDFLCNVPVYGYYHRLKLAGGNEEWAMQFPGVIHFWLMHIVFPYFLFNGLMVVLTK